MRKWMICQVEGSGGWKVGVGECMPKSHALYNLSRVLVKRPLEELLHWSWIFFDNFQKPLLAVRAFTLW